jgi:transposase InsO family protein
VRHRRADPADEPARRSGLFAFGQRAGVCQARDPARLTNAHIETAIVDPGKSWQNGTKESLNGKFRYESLSIEWLRTRREVQVIIEAWQQHYNAVRPHSSLGYLTPFEFKQHHPPAYHHPKRSISQE